jgi:hypothetical protein
MQMDVQPDANAVFHPVIQNRRPAGPRARRKENPLVLTKDRIPDMSKPINI